MDDQRFDSLARFAAGATRRQILKAVAGAAGGGLLALVGAPGAPWTWPRRAEAAPCFPGALDCAGCCLNRFCVNPPTNANCGLGGAACVPCGENQVCRNGACEGPAPRQECEGCYGYGATRGWIDDLIFGRIYGCVAGTNHWACGRGGGTCDECDEGERCENHTCVACADTCAGCCTDVGLCKPGNRSDSCGQGGDLCDECDEDEFCRDAECVDCDEDTCEGCCAPRSCERGDSHFFCGTGGVSCTECAIGEFCENGKCVACADRCTGCCTAEGECVLPGTSVDACGLNGVPCQQCPSDRGCFNGICAPCSAETCRDGCCQGSICIRPATTDRVCGTGGARCESCHTGRQCVDGVCRCTPESCRFILGNGCCADNLCWPGTDDARCGRGGEACTHCAEDLVCVRGVCTPCSAETCRDGCCQGANCIRPGTTEDACGTGGIACRQCATGQTCRDGICRCLPVEAGGHCPGCCRGDECRPGDSSFACGRRGEQCDLCETDEVCGDDGSCVPCRENCDGCCDVRTCLPGTATAFCGKGGEQCTLCAIPEERCIDQTCRRTCQVVPCPGGCCDDDQLCQPGTESAACGKDGGTCATCPPGTRCTAGACVCDRESCPTGCCQPDPVCDAGGGQRRMIQADGDCTDVCAPCPDGAACASDADCAGGVCDGDGTCQTSGCPEGEPCDDGDPCTTGDTCRDGVCAGDAVSGCCRSNGDCIDDDPCTTGHCEIAPGAAAGTCVTTPIACAERQRCVDGRCICDPVSCPGGCCDGDVCREGNRDEACGHGGETCDTCEPGTRCWEADCLCDELSCSGCCRNGACLDGNTSEACGYDGEPCDTCGPGTRCWEADCLCDQASCPDGCCDENRDCQPGRTDDACGTGGESCRPCTNGATCQDGECVPSGRRVGMADLPAIPPVPKGYAVVSAAGGASLDQLAAGGVTIPPDLADVVDSYFLRAARPGTEPGTGDEPPAPTRALDTLVVRFASQRAAEAAAGIVAGEIYPSAGVVDGVLNGAAGPYREYAYDGTQANGTSFGARVGFVSLGELFLLFSFWDFAGKIPGGSTLRKEIQTAAEAAGRVLDGSSPGLFDRIPVLTGPWVGRYNIIDGTSRADYGADAEDQRRTRDRTRGIRDYAVRYQLLPAPAQGQFSGWLRRYDSETEAVAAFRRVSGYLAEDAQRFGFSFSVNTDEPDRYRIVQRFSDGFAAVQEWWRVGDEILGGMVVGGIPYRPDEEMPDRYVEGLHATLDGYQGLFDCPQPCIDERETLERALRLLVLS